jgi:hypothetical protein
MSQDQRDKVLSQLGGFVYELSTLRFLLSFAAISDENVDGWIRSGRDG